MCTIDLRYQHSLRKAIDEFFLQYVDSEAPDFPELDKFQLAETEWDHLQKYSEILKVSG